MEMNNDLTEKYKSFLIPGALTILVAIVVVVLLISRLNNSAKLVNDNIVLEDSVDLDVIQYDFGEVVNRPDSDFELLLDSDFELSGDLLTVREKIEYSENFNERTISTFYLTNLEGSKKLPFIKVAGNYFNSGLQDNVFSLESNGVIYLIDFNNKKYYVLKNFQGNQSFIVKRSDYDSLIIYGLDANCPLISGTDSERLEQNGRYGYRDDLECNLYQGSVSQKNQRLISSDFNQKVQNRPSPVTIVPFATLQHIENNQLIIKGQTEGDLPGFEVYILNLETSEFRFEDMISWNICSEAGCTFCQGDRACEEKEYQADINYLSNLQKYKIEQFNTCPVSAYKLIYDATGCLEIKDQYLIDSDYLHGVNLNWEDWESDLLLTIPLLNGTARWAAEVGKSLYDDPNLPRACRSIDDCQGEDVGYIYTSFHGTELLEDLDGDSDIDAVVGAKVSSPLGGTNKPEYLLVFENIGNSKRHIKTIPLESAFINSIRYDWLDEVVVVDITLFKESGSQRKEVNSILKYTSEELGF